MRTTKQFIVPAALALLLAVGGAACSSGGEDNANEDVATLGASNDQGNSNDDSDDSEDDGGGGGRGGGEVDPEFQDAVLEFAECMRDHGIDMPDPQISEDGGVMIQAGGVAVAQGEDGGFTGPSEEEMQEMEDAQEACEPIMEAVRGSMPEPDPEQLAEMQDQALEFAQCMRDHGIDFPDPDFSGEGGRMTVAIGGPADGDGPAFDPNDEEFQEASEECGEEGGFGFTGPAVRVGGDDGEDG